MNDLRIERINELYRKKKTVGLSEEEEREHRQLRKNYVEAFKTSLRAHLESIKFVDKPRQ